MGEKYNRGLRNAAKLRGDAHYHTGVPCKNGHVEKRMVSNGRCMECSRLSTEHQRKKETPEQKYARLHKSAERASLWRLKNQDHANTKLVKQRWKKENVGAVRAATIKRRVSKLFRTPVWLDAVDYAEINFTYDYCAALRAIGMDYHVDHIVPLQGKEVSGFHVPWNLQVIHAKDNLQKANHLRK